MNSIIYAFGLGLSFAAGAFVGALVCKWAIKQAIAKVVGEHETLNNRIEDRLEKYVANTERIATAVELLVERE